MIARTLNQIFPHRFFQRNPGEPAILPMAEDDRLFWDWFHRTHPKPLGAKHQGAKPPHQTAPHQTRENAR